MAKRFGGKYSPDGTDADVSYVEKRPYGGAKASKVGFQVNLLFVAPLPLIFAMFSGGGAAGFGLALVALGLLLLAAWLTREGILAHEAYDARKVARKPAFPRKIAGAVVTGAGLTAAGFSEMGLAAVVPGLAGTALHLFAFGPDPMRNKGFDGVDQFQQDRVARVVDDAEGTLAIMQATVENLGDRTVQARVEDFQATARTLFRRVEEDPSDLTAARKYLSVYLTGAKDATQKFAGLYANKRDPKSRQDFLTFLDDLEGNFTAKTDTLLANNKTDLDIEMKVLRDRLAREGLQTD